MVKRVCFVGASNVEGQGDETGEGWVGRLVALHKDEGTSLISYRLGIRGQTLSQIVARAAVECAPRLPKDGSGLIVMTTGVNDLARVRNSPPRLSLNDVGETLEAAIPSLLEIAPLIVVGPTPVDDAKMPLLAGPNDVPVFFGNEDIRVANNRYNNICNGAGAAYLNLFEALLTDEAYCTGLSKNDGLHTDACGYKAMARYVHESPAWRHQMGLT